TADDPTRYRDDKEVKEWEKRDPLIRFTKYLRNKGVLDDRSIEGIENDIKEEIVAALKRYESYDGLDPMDSFKHIVSELPADLRAQQQEYEAALRAEGNYRE
ncbi:MAG: pyruvate dehydrogenase (acetyl-transferring) E1 component subunit alpha, partial [Planctomycetes bacterium]|nr:pyruvate dehydrogenase (acetyl-transferring) E1 component subunit alpha [Planctomycetota bacterium]